MDLRGYAWAIVRDDKILTSGSIPKLIDVCDITDSRYYINMADKLNGQLYIGDYTITTERPTGLIFGKTWEEIQAMQNRTYVPKCLEQKMPKNAVLIYPL